jgi:hypothetical protein
MPSFSFAVMHMPEDIGAQTITYKIWKTNAIQDLGLEVQYQHLGADPQKSNDQTNVVRATAMYERYWNKNNKFSARLFGGKFFSQGNAPFFMGLSGSPDYLRETIMLDRAQKSDGIRGFIDQTDNKEGAFKNYTTTITDNWLTSLNLQTEIPKLPLDVYLDLGRVANNSKTFYGTGLALNIGKGFFSLYLPIAGSNFENNTPEDFKDFRQNIRFSLQLNKFNPFKLLNENL